MTKQILTGIAAAAGLVAVAASANAETITVTSGGVVGGVFSYTISEDTAGRVSDLGLVPNVATTPFISPGTMYDDYFTIYDFAGFTGAHTEPAGWTFLSQAIGPTDSNIVAADTSIANLTWYYTGGGAPLIGPFVLSGFSATSTFTGSNPLGQWSSEDTQNGGMNDGTTNAATGKVVVPANVPDSGSTLMFLGMGLLGAAWARRRVENESR